MGVNPCHPIKSAAVPPNFTETSWCQMPFVEKSEQLAYFWIALLSCIHLTTELLCILPSLLSHYSSAPHEHMSNGMLQQGKWYSEWWARFLHESPIVTWTHTLLPAILVLLSCVRIKPIIISLHTQCDKRKKSMNDSYAEIQIAATCLLKPKVAQKVTERCRGILCVVLPTELYFRLNLPPAKMMWKSEPLLFSAVRCTCNEHTMLVWEDSPKCWGLRKRGAWFILFVRRAFIRGRVRKRPWL